MTNQKIKIAITGATGRMGQMLIQAVKNDPALELTAALDIKTCPSLGQDAGFFMGWTSGVKITSDLSELAKAQVLIDFTRPEATITHIQKCKETSTAIVIGTTGFSEEEKNQIANAGKDIAIVFAPNMSAGVNATFKILEIAAKILGEGYDVEIIEAHHKHKVDAPAGTALKMGEVVAKALGKDLEKSAVYARVGQTGARPEGCIGFSTIRAGDIVGEHTVMFAGDGEQIEIKHKSTSRASYAKGSLKAAKFLADKKSGLFNMNDVLGL